jgi:HAD superfamily hydrolase (TIGR01490 family)
MLGKHIRAGPLSSKNDAGPLRLQTASPKRIKIGANVNFRGVPSGGAWRPNMNIAIYDLDKTITRRPTFTRFLLYYARRTAPFRLALLPIWIMAMVGYKLRLYGRKPLKQFGVRMFMGREISPANLSEITASFADNEFNQGLQPGAIARLHADRARGAMLVLATAAPEFYAKLIGNLADFHAVIATRHILTPDGALTHEIEGENCYAGEKLRRIEEWLSQQAIDRKDAHIIFYSDDISDSPTLNFADEGYAVNPSKKFAEAAARANWGRLDFRHAEGISNRP